MSRTNDAVMLHLYDIRNVHHRRLREDTRCANPMLMSGVRVRKPNKKKTINIKYTSRIIIAKVILLFYCCNNITTTRHTSSVALSGFTEIFIFIYLPNIRSDKSFHNVTYIIVRRYLFICTCDRTTHTIFYFTKCSVHF